MTDQQRYSHNRPASPGAEQSRPLWQYYVGITTLLLVMVVALAGGIIWYNSKKSNQLAIAAAERMMLEAGDDVSNRIKLLYDPMYAIVGIASLVPELISPAIKEDPRARSLLIAPVDEIEKPITEIRNQPSSTRSRSLSLPCRFT